jgi:hypothetical protein
VRALSCALLALGGAAAGYFGLGAGAPPAECAAADAPGADQTAQPLATADREGAERTRCSRLLAAGGRVEIAPTAEAVPQGAHGGAAERIRAIELAALGPLTDAEEAPFYEEEIRRLAELRRAAEALAREAQDERAHWELLELRSDELRSLATLELLDRDEYWVFPAQSPGLSLVGRLVGRYGVRAATKDGAPVKLVYPYAADRFPLLAELVPARRAAESAAQEALVREFAALPRERRELFRELAERPELQLVPGTGNEAFYQRYALLGLDLDLERLVLVRP